MSVSSKKRVTLLKEETTFGGILKVVHKLKKPPETPIEIVIKELQLKTLKKQKKIRVLRMTPYKR